VLKTIDHRDYPQFPVYEDKRSQVSAHMFAKDSVLVFDADLDVAKWDADLLCDKAIKHARKEYYDFVTDRCRTIAVSGPSSQQLDPWTGRKLELSGIEDAQKEYTRLMALMPCQGSVDGAKVKGDLLYSAGGREFYVESADSVKPLPVEWIWEGRIPRGMLVIMSGNAGVGKSQVSLYVAARVSTGTGWTDGAKATLKPSTILIAAAEDDPARTVVPRLIAASADLSRIKFLRPVKATELVKSGRDEVMSTSLRELQLQADLDALRETLKANPDIALVILDPITGYFGCDQRQGSRTSPGDEQTQRRVRRDRCGHGHQPSQQEKRSGRTAKNTGRIQLRRGGACNLGAEPRPRRPEHPPHGGGQDERGRRGWGAEVHAHRDNSRWGQDFVRGLAGHNQRDRRQPDREAEGTGENGASGCAERAGAVVPEDDARRRGAARTGVVR
jgi:AAA domain